MTRERVRRSLRAFVVTLAATVAAATTAHAQVVISQVYGGGGNTGAPYNADFVELFNRGSESVSLAGSSVQYASATGTGNFGANTGQLVVLSGTIAPGRYYLVQLAGGANGVALPTPDATGTIAAAAGAGKFALVTGTTGLGCNGGSTPCTAEQLARIVDLVGYGNANFFEGSGAAPTLSNTTAALRANNGCTDTNNNAADFTAGTPAPRNSASPVASCAPQDPDPDPDPTDSCDAAFTPIYAIQGSGASVAITGTVTTMGVVVGDYEGPSPTLRGFYIQDPVGDDDPTTSDGIFVFNGNNNSVNLGDMVRVTGTAADFQDQSQISAAANGVLKCGTGSVEPVDVVFPVPSADYLERYEGMLVRLPQAMAVTEHFQLGRFGQVVVSSGGRLAQPTQVATPGAPAMALQAANDLNRIIIDDDSQGQNPDPIVFGRDGQPLSASNTLRGGDTVTGLVGVMTYTWAGNAASGNAYRVRPVNALGGTALFEAVNPRPTAVPDVGGNVRVATVNLLNYYNTFTGCFAGLTGSALDCRGAENTTEFERQAAKTIAALLALDADIVGLVEVENDGYGEDSAIQDLVDRLNAATTPGTWAFIDADAGTGIVDVLGSDGIKVGLIYRPSNVTPVGQTAALDTGAFGLFELGDGRIQQRNRPALTQSFEVANGARLTVSVLHLISKSASCGQNVAPVGPDPDLGDGQGLCNLTRVAAIEQLLAWLETDPTGTGDTDHLLVGDLNAYAKEDPLTVLANANFTNLVPNFGGSGTYSYVFDGQWGSLDHAVVSPSLLGQVTGAAVFHINSDEPNVLDYNTNFKSAGQISSLYAPDKYRSSDHDPIVVGFNLRNDAPVVMIGGPYEVVEGGSVLLEADGYDPDGGAVSFAWDLDNDGVFETPGQTAVFVADGGVGTFPVRVRVTDDTGVFTDAATTVTVIFNWTGFFRPMVNLPAWNSAQAGRAVPVKFSLGGDKGLNVLAPGFPVSLPISCSGDGTADSGTPTASAGGSQLSYDGGQYNYVWKTDRSWAGTCRLLVVTLVDGTTHEAAFRFAR